MQDAPRARGRRADLIRSGSTAFLVRVTGMAATYLFNVLVARLYGAQATGVFALCTTVVMALSMIGRLGLDRAMVRFVAVFRSRGDTEQAGRHYAVALALVSVTSVFLSVLLFVLAPQVSSIVFRKPELTPQLQLVAPAVFLFGVVLLNAEALRGLQLISQFALVRYASVYAFAFLALGLGAGFVPVELRPNFSFAVGTLVAAGVSTLLVLRRLTPRLRGAAGALKPILIVTLPMLMSSSLGMLIQWADVFIMGRFASASTVGIYAMALKLAFIVSMGLEAVNSTTAPRLAEAYGRGARSEIRAIMKDATRLLFWASLPLVLVLAVLGDTVLGIFGDEFRSGATALLILTLGQFVSALSGPIGSFLQMTGGEKPFMYIVGVCSVLNVGLNLILIPRFGMLGAATVSAGTLILNNVLCMAIVWRRFGFVSLYLPLPGLNR